MKATPDDISTALSGFLIDNILKSELPQTLINRCNSPVKLITTKLTNDDTTKTIETANSSLSGINLIIPFLFSILLAISIMISSTYMLQGLGGEKENRLMEILLSSVSTRQLLTGKVLGLAAAGLIQALVWVISLPFLLKFGKSVLGGVISTIELPIEFLVLGIIFFILGYILFATLCAGIGAINSTYQEGTQIASIFLIFILIPLWTASGAIMYPDSIIWKIITFFPLTAPTEVMVRLGTGSIEIWEMIVSAAVLALSIIGELFITIKFFKAYLLMYGKRPKFTEIIRSFKTN